MKQEVIAAVAGIVKRLYGFEGRVELTRPEEQFGDYATNIALQLAKTAGKSPREVAEAIANELPKELEGRITEATVAGPGFINVRLSDAALQEYAAQALTIRPDTYQDQLIVLEYSDPNPFKVLHVGHLYQSAVSDAIARLLVYAGADLRCVNFGGDVGLHVARAMWAILQELGGEYPERLADIPTAERSDWMARAYVKGTRADEEDEAAKQEIIEINKRVYQVHETGDHDSPFAQIYWICRQWSYDYFDAFYARVGSHFDKYYPESQTTPLGVQTVREQTEKGVYEMSDGAIVFRGEPYSLHTRVFINSHGLPTYEAKDVGLTMAKWRDYKFDKTIIITGNDIIEYMKVVLKSIEQFNPELVKRTVHLTHGNVKLAGGVKMSSRRGNFLRATDVLDIVAEASRKSGGDGGDTTVLGAVKYAFIRQRLGPDLIFDPQESVSLDGCSGPYLQYAHARACSILGRANTSNTEALEFLGSLEPGERSLVRKISEYPEVIQQSVEELMPHHVAIYLYELAQVFNRFYENNLVIGDPREATRLRIVSQYADTLKAGLSILGIEAPDRM